MDTLYGEGTQMLSLWATKAPSIQTERKALEAKYLSCRYVHLTVVTLVLLLFLGLAQSLIQVFGLA